MKTYGELNIDKLLGSLEEYLRKYEYSNQDIEGAKIDFIKQSFFNRIIKQYDENNHNWGILVNKKTHSVRMAPLYDMECSCEINKRSKKMRKTKDGSTTNLEQFIRQFKNESWFKWYIEEIIENFDLEKAFKQSEIETNTKIPEKYKQKYKDFFALRFHELKQAYENVYASKGENDINIDDKIK